MNANQFTPVDDGTDKDNYDDSRRKGRTSHQLYPRMNAERCAKLAAVRYARAALAAAKAEA